MQWSGWVQVCRHGAAGLQKQSNARRAGGRLAPPPAASRTRWGPCPGCCPAPAPPRCRAAWCLRQKGGGEGGVGGGVGSREGHSAVDVAGAARPAAPPHAPATHRSAPAAIRRCRRCPGSTPAAVQQGERHEAVRGRPARSPPAGASTASAAHACSASQPPPLQPPHPPTPTHLGGAVGAQVHALDDAADDDKGAGPLLQVGALDCGARGGCGDGLGVAGGRQHAREAAWGRGLAGWAAGAR